MDLQFDATADGRRLKFLNVFDEHSRLCLAIRVGQRCKVKDVVTMLEDLISLYPVTALIRSDNGLEFIAHASDTGLKAAATQMRKSSPDLRCRTALLNHARAESGTSSKISNCLPPWQMPKP
jgi:hypothetical protein